MTKASPPRAALGALYCGLALTLLAIVAVHVDHATTNYLAAHIKAGYPDYSRAQVDSAAQTYLIYLTVLGALGAIGWLITLWLAGAGKAGAKWLAVGLWATGVSIAVFNLVIRDTSGDTGLPPLLSSLGLLPCLAGVLAVGALWKRALWKRALWKRPARQEAA